jgi:GT2 family glycosyltransferase
LAAARRLSSIWHTVRSIAKSARSRYNPAKAGDVAHESWKNGADARSGAPGPGLAHVGVVAIGRNEGERLQRCLRSLPANLGAAVYVDSGSTDDSVAFARSRGVQVVELDMSTPFTAARARNAGIERLRGLLPSVKFVQVLDGDCELVDGFMESAAELLDADASLGVVCGRRRELHPETSHYNLLCDMEWNTPVGEADACGGDALMRLAAFDAAGGYDPALIAGEEPDMCSRMRRAGYRILRIDREMTRHDAAMTHFEQWWKRNQRAGHATAQWYDRYPDEGSHRRNLRSNLVFGLLVPGTAAGLMWPSAGFSLSLLGLYAAPWWGARRYRMEICGDGAREASLYATYCVIGKVPQAVGILQFHANRLRGRQSRLIEYKQA